MAQRLFDTPMQLALAAPLAVIAPLALPGVLLAPAAAQERAGATPASSPTYADLASLIEAADVVARVSITDQITVPPERAPGLARGFSRLFIEARTEALLTGSSPLGQSLRYLVDVPLGANGKPPKLKKTSVLLFAKPVAGRPGELQLVRPGAQLAATPELDGQVRAIITALVSPDAPPVIIGVRDVISIPGNLVGESETQMLLETKQGDPVSLTILRRPGMAPKWGISWSEIVDQSARPPEPDTVEWYRLACSLPRDLPSDSFLQPAAADRDRARADYQLVLDRLGPCAHTLF